MLFIRSSTAASKPISRPTRPALHHPPTSTPCLSGFCPSFLNASYLPRAPGTSQTCQRATSSISLSNVLSVSFDRASSFYFTTRDMPSSARHLPNKLPTLSILIACLRLPRTTIIFAVPMLALLRTSPWLSLTTQTLTFATSSIRSHVA